ncbi:hypothetical protein [Nonomuraea sp. SBT364]|uniref:hypothetical protein n=1 Tax=Nonomuraea sp. SBT364 TaxID=1580530 RepID=UPI000AE2DE46|nr:hypothetical protein [Nonomuraea sp. SBT364]
MRKLLTVAAASLFLAAGVAAATPVQAAAEAGASSAVAKTPLRYYDTYYGPNPWWLCYDRGYRGVNNNEWYDFECRPGTYWVELWIQVAP